MMKISVKSVHFHADAKLLAFVEQKVSRLNRYFENAIHAEVHLKIEESGNKIKEKVAEIQLHLPGSNIIDKKAGRTFEATINASVESLKRQLVRHKQKGMEHPIIVARSL